MKHTSAFSVCALLAALAVAPACRAQDPVAPAPAAPAAPERHQAGAAEAAPATQDPATPPRTGRPRVSEGGFTGMLPGMEADPETQAMQKELQKLQMKSQIRQAKLQEELAPLTEAAQRLQLQAQSDGTNSALQKEVQKIQAEGQLRQAKAQAELAGMTEEMGTLQAKMGLAKARRDAAQAAAMEAEDKANFELQLKLAANARKSKELQSEVERISAEAALAQAKLSDQNRQLDVETKRLQLAMQAKDIRDKAAKTVLSEIEYADNPLKDGVLTITDRRIDLNGVISVDSVGPAIERLHFLSNQSTKPIFIVIDMSPGGSVAAGVQLLKAMDSSRAPVHVVVKTFAASMAATICTLAKHSYAYDSTIILHHQLSYGAKGNLTQQKEQNARSKQWYERIGKPVADKMGIKLEDYVKEMYKHNSDGDWEEFGDEAQKLKWVNHVVTEIREAGIRASESSPPAPVIRLFGQAGKAAEGAEAGEKLPRLQPYDCWFLYNKDGYYHE